jgi:hypothetical protein
LKKIKMSVIDLKCDASSAKAPMSAWNRRFGADECVVAMNSVTIGLKYTGKAVRRKTGGPDKCVEFCRAWALTIFTTRHCSRLPEPHWHVICAAFEASMMSLT